MERDMRSGSPRLSRLALALCAAALWTATGCKKSDAERAAAERAEVREMMQTSWRLAPYRWLKVAVRSRADPERMKPLVKVVGLLRETEQLHAVEEKGVSEVASLSAAYVKLGAALVAAKGDLDAHDEDTYPLVWTVFDGEAPPYAWYDNGAEHLGLGLLWIATALSTGRSSDSLKGMHGPNIFYELDRAQVQMEWPLPLRLTAYLARGAAFYGTGYHYAAEEELDRYIADAEALPEPAARSERAAVVAPPRSQPTSRPGSSPASAAGSQPTSGVNILDEHTVWVAAQAAGFFLRAANRMELGRDDAATDDLERGLRVLEQGGIENELTLWGWTLVYLQRGQTKEAGERLRRLAESPYVDEAFKPELLRAAQTLQGRGGATGLFASLKRASASVVVARALLARVGGVQGLLLATMGEERGGRLARGALWFADVREGIARNLSVEGGVESAKALGGRGVDFLKSKLRRAGVEDGGVPEG